MSDDNFISELGRWLQHGSPIMQHFLAAERWWREHDSAEVFQLTRVDSAMYVSHIDRVTGEELAAMRFCSVRHG